MKYLLAICDGMADIGAETPLSRAAHPGLDFLAKNGAAGTIDLKYKDVIDSDEGMLKLLGCYDDTYPGRGYLEALSAGIECGENDVLIRGNFATLDEEDMLVDRRAGRDETGLDELAESIDNVEIDNVRFTVRRTLGHRVVIVMSDLNGRKLSDKISSNDPKAVNVAVKQIRALKPPAKRVAAALNKFLFKAHVILDAHETNRARSVPANFVLIRNSGHKTETESFESRYGLRACCVSAHPVMLGVAKFLGIDTITPDGATGLPDTDLAAKTRAVMDALGEYDFVILHVNGFDILSHERKPDQKRSFIEGFDRDVIAKVLDSVDMNETVIIVTCDHRSASSPSHKGYEHQPDPVPFCACGDGIKSSGAARFDENVAGLRLCKNELLKAVFRLARA